MPFSPPEFVLDYSSQMPQAVSMGLKKKSCSIHFSLQKEKKKKKKGNILRQRDCNNNLDQVFVYDGIE